MFQLLRRTWWIWVVALFLGVTLILLHGLGWIPTDVMPSWSKKTQQPYPEAKPAALSQSGFRASCDPKSSDVQPPPISNAAPAPNMVWVPGGHYTPGDTVHPEEKPAGQVQVRGFWMDRTEVTNQAFAEFVAATGYVTVAERPADPAKHPPGTPAAWLQPGAAVFKIPTQPSDNPDPSTWWQWVTGAQWRHPGGIGTNIAGREHYPVVAITVADAQAYAQWKGRSLPTEAQWEWAARGALSSAPSSDEQPKEANTWQGRFPVVDTGTDGFVGIAPVGCYASNRLGLYDMIGNVWELTQDEFAPHGAQARPTLPQRTGPRRYVMKGGSYLCTPGYCMRYRPGARQPQEEDLATSHVGFRTVLN